MKVKLFKNDYRVEKPKCYTPNTDPYPLCKGASHPQEFAENDCINCCLYESMADEGECYVQEDGAMENVRKC